MRILHVFRTPVGGLFRHVRDMARGLTQDGHEVGIVCDSASGGDAADLLLATAQAHCALGIHRIPISRLPGLGDISGARLVAAKARAVKPDIIHGHGAKGGLYGRLAGKWLGVPSVYTPHGGSLHYEWKSPGGAVFLAAERALAHAGNALHFVCEFERDAFAVKIGTAGRPCRVIYNGLWPEEFTAATPDRDAADILFIGEMRSLKGVDVLLEAVARLGSHSTATACLVGDGAELAAFRQQADRLGLGGRVTFPGRLSAQQAFSRGRLLVMPSRNESFPYVVLEAAAANVPILASRVGGIPEVLTGECLVPPGDAEALAHRLAVALANPEGLRRMAATTRQRVEKDFTASQMVNGAVSFYRDLSRS